MSTKKAITKRKEVLSSSSRPRLAVDRGEVKKKFISVRHSLHLTPISFAFLFAAASPREVANAIKISIVLRVDLAARTWDWNWYMTSFEYVLPALLEFQFLCFDLLVSHTMKRLSSAAMNKQSIHSSP